ncbi:MAG: hypothetical protein QOE23_1975, partial [Pseudonocardiales bacterium]|nr:hypothetical protein [Pseudonocardiales bacterium]
AILVRPIDPVLTARTVAETLRARDTAIPVVR